MIPTRSPTTAAVSARSAPCTSTATAAAEEGSSLSSTSTNWKRQSAVADSATADADSNRGRTGAAAASDVGATAAGGRESPARSAGRTAAESSTVSSWNSSIR